MICLKCGNNVHEGIKFCPYCGNNMEQNNEQVQVQSVNQNIQIQNNVSSENTQNINSLNSNNNQITNNNDKNASNGLLQQSNNQKKHSKPILAIFGILGLVIILIILYLSFGKNKDDVNKTLNNNDEYIYTGSKQNINIATIGQIDHGKTLLTSAITKLYGKYVSEETLNKASSVNKNGVIYNVANVSYETENRHYNHFDFPLNNDFIKAIVAGNMELDGAILVVSAEDGVMPQTREQLYLLHHVGVNKVVVYISKCDSVKDSSVIDLVESDINRLLNEYEYSADTPIIRGSADKAIAGDSVEENNIRSLVNEIDRWINPALPHEVINSTEVDALIYTLTKEESGKYQFISNDYKAKFNFSDFNVEGSIILPTGISMIMPGDNVIVNIKLDNKISIKEGGKFQIKKDDKVIAVGVVISTSSSIDSSDNENVVVADNINSDNDY